MKYKLIKAATTFFMVQIFVGCSGTSTESQTDDTEGTEELVTSPISYDGVYMGRIVHKDKSPYVNGIVRAVSDGWESNSTTNENGEFSVKVNQNERFVFLAFNPYGQRKDYPYKNPMIINEEKTYDSYDCNDTEFMEDCFEKKPIGV